MSIWENNGNYLEAHFKFNSFQEALKFVNKVGQIAEIQNHHPDINMHDYNEVAIKTTTHDRGYRVTEKDTRLANAIDGLF